MEKIKLLLTIRGGNIQHIASTSENIEIRIIDHDNLQMGEVNDINNLDNRLSPDVIMSTESIDDIINTIRKIYLRKLENN